MAKKNGSSNPRPTHDEIAALARAIYQEKGCQPGHDLDNWLEAEKRLIRASQNVSTQVPARAASPNPNPQPAKPNPQPAKAAVRPGATPVLR